MKRLGLIGLMSVIAAMVVVGMWGAGCDTVKDATTAITVSPRGLTVTGLWAIVYTTDTNASLYLPLEWSVSDARLGSIDSQSGLTAIYRTNAEVGLNTIKVRDQGESEGIAIISQVRALGMTLTPPSATIQGAGALLQFSVASTNTLVLPLEWISGDLNLGWFVSSGGFDAVYTSSGVFGNNIITVNDQLGAQATAIIQHR